MKIINTKTDSLFIEQFHVQDNDAWCIIGSNHSGIEDFFQLSAGEDMNVTAEYLKLRDDSCVISFKKQQALYESELKKDETDFLDRIDPGTPAKFFLHDIETHMDFIEAFDMENCLDKGYRQLSTGQSRKLIMLSQFTKGMSFLIVQSPFEGLDPQSRKEVDKALCRLYHNKVTLLIFVNNVHDIPCWCTHAGVVAEGVLKFQGQKDLVMNTIELEIKKDSPGFQVSAMDVYVEQEEEPLQNDLVCLKKGSAGYGEHLVFKDLTLNICKGCHTLISGPNGSGKSTLLQVITGDHPACYQNDLRIFGVRRGSGESIWDLKKKMGIVSSELHRNYYVPGSALHCVISGLFDSIGLYKPYTRAQEQLAMEWLARINMVRKALKPFRDLSFADQRLVLIARALIKVPKMLILDEPTQGLDELNRKAVLDFLELAAKKDISTILYVSHREDEFRDFFVQHIQMQ